jgi:hypothetical protein
MNRHGERLTTFGRSGGGSSSVRVRKLLSSLSAHVVSKVIPELCGLAPNVEYDSPRRLTAPEETSVSRIPRLRALSRGALAAAVTVSVHDWRERGG